MAQKCNIEEIINALEDLMSDGCTKTAKDYSYEIESAIDELRKYGKLKEDLFNSWLKNNVRIF